MIAGRRRVAIAAAAVAVVLAAPTPAPAVDRSLGATAIRPAETGAVWTAAERAALGRDIDAFIAGAPAVRGAHLGLLAVETRSGDVLLARGADDAFVPASTMKTLTGSAALALLGADRRAHTEAFARAGDPTLYLRAGGDPLLAGSDVASAVRAAQGAAGDAPLRSVQIDADGWSSDPYPPGWQWDDFSDDYAARLTPLPVDENAADVHVLPGSAPGAPAIVRGPGAPTGCADVDVPQLVGNDADGATYTLATPVDPALPAWLGVRNAATTGAAGSPITVDLRRTLELPSPVERGIALTAVTGSLAVDAPPDTEGLALADPARRLAAIVASCAAQPSSSPSSDPAAAQLRIASGPVPAGARSVWMDDGEPLRDLVADMWFPSDNFVAEMLTRALGRASSARRGTTEAGIAAEKRWLRGIGVDPAGLTIVDGSGLSPYDRLTPRALVALLQADWRGPQRSDVLDDLPLAGVRGTLSHRFIGTLAAGRVYAKDGSVMHARGLTGYVATLRHGAVTFALMVDDWQGTDAGLDELRGRILARIVGG